MRVHRCGHAALAALTTAVALGAMPAAAQPPRAEAAPRALPPVEVAAMRDPVAKSYRRIVEGIALFGRRRDLAPGAALRFRFVPRRDATDLEGIALRIVGQTVAIPVPVAADGTFALPLDAKALEEDAIVVPDRRAGTLTWRADVRTPGLPPHTRRLGDLRLECRVGMAAGLVSDYPPTLFGALARLLADDPCAQRAPRYFFFADRPLWRVTLVHGEHRAVLPVDRMYAGATERPMTDADFRHCDCAVWLDRTYFAPLGDPGWPDDTQVVFEYMEEADTDELLRGRRADDLPAAFGVPTAVRFASGYAVRVYREEGPPAVERIVLVTPANVVAAARVAIVAP